MSPWPDTPLSLCCPQCGEESPETPDFFWLTEVWAAEHEHEARKAA